MALVSLKLCSLNCMVLGGDGMVLSELVEARGAVCIQVGPADPSIAVKTSCKYFLFFFSAQTPSRTPMMMLKVVA